MYLEIFLVDFAVFHTFLEISGDFAEIPEFGRSATARKISEALFKCPSLSSHTVTVSL